MAGEVCLWDIRLTEPVRTIQAHRGGLVQLAVHEHAPIFATYVARFNHSLENSTDLIYRSGSAFNVIKVWNLAEEEPVSKFRTSCEYLAFALLTSFSRS